MAEPLRLFELYCEITSNDPHYADRLEAYGNQQELSAFVTLADNDVAAISVPEISISEPNADSMWAAADDDALFYEVKLTSQPVVDVIVFIDLFGNGTVPVYDDVLLSPSNLTFNRSSWNDSQLVSIAAVDDQIDEGEGYYISVLHRTETLDPMYTTELTLVEAYVLDNDISGMVLSDEQVTVTEGRDSVASYFFTLQSQPTAAVVVSIEPSPGITVSSSSLTFEALNWDEPLTIEVRAIDDFVARGDSSSAVAHFVHSEDPNYSGRSLADVHVTIKDNDVAGVVFSAGAVAFEE